MRKKSVSSPKFGYRNKIRFKNNVGQLRCSSLYNYLNKNKTFKREVKQKTKERT